MERCTGGYVHIILLLLALLLAVPVRDSPPTDDKQDSSSLETNPNYRERIERLREIDAEHCVLDVDVETVAQMWNLRMNFYIIIADHVDGLRSDPTQLVRTARQQEEARKRSEGTSFVPRYGPDVLEQADVLAQLSKKKLTEVVDVLREEARMARGQVLLWGASARSDVESSAKARVNACKAALVPEPAPSLMVKEAASAFYDYVEQHGIVAE